MGSVKKFFSFGYKRKKETNSSSSKSNNHGTPTKDMQESAYPFSSGKTSKEESHGNKSTKNHSEVEYGLKSYQRERSYGNLSIGNGFQPSTGLIAYEPNDKLHANFSGKVQTMDSRLTRSKSYRSTVSLPYSPSDRPTAESYEQELLGDGLHVKKNNFIGDGMAKRQEQLRTTSFSQSKEHTSETANISYETSQGRQQSNTHDMAYYSPRAPAKHSDHKPQTTTTRVNSNPRLSCLGQQNCASTTMSYNPTRGTANNYHQNKQYNDSNSTNHRGSLLSMQNYGTVAMAHTPGPFRRADSFSNRTATYTEDAVSLALTEHDHYPVERQQHPETEISVIEQGNIEATSGNKFHSIAATDIWGKEVGEEVRLFETTAFENTETEHLGVGHQIKHKSPTSEQTLRKEYLDPMRQRPIKTKHASMTQPGMQQGSTERKMSANKERENRNTERQASLAEAEYFQASDPVSDEENDDLDYFSIGNTSYAESSTMQGKIKKRMKLFKAISNTKFVPKKIRHHFEIALMKELKKLNGSVESLNSSLQAMRTDVDDVKEGIMLLHDNVQVQTQADQFGFYIWYQVICKIAHIAAQERKENRQIFDKLLVSLYPNANKDSIKRERSEIIKITPGFEAQVRECLMRWLFYKRRFNRMAIDKLLKSLKDIGLTDIKEVITATINRSSCPEEKLCKFHSIKTL